MKFKTKAAKRQSLQAKRLAKTRMSKSGSLDKRPTKRSQRALTNPLVLSKNTNVGTPEFIKSTAGGIRIRFRELISPSLPKQSFPGISEHTINGFSYLGSFNVNPGLEGTFPWLSAIARRYDQWHQHRVTFEYVPGLSASTNGFFYAVPDYDVTDAVPRDPRSAMNQMGAVSTPVWNPISTALREQAAMSVGPRRFIRYANTASDNRLSDTAVLHTFVSDYAPDALSGQLWINYDIELRAPQIQSSVGGVSNRASKKETIIAGANAIGSILAGGGVTSEVPVLTTNTSFAANGLNFTKSNLANGLFSTLKDVPTVFNLTADFKGHAQGDPTPATPSGRGLMDIAWEALDATGTLLSDLSFIRQVSTATASGKPEYVANNFVTQITGKATEYLVDELAARSLNPGIELPISYRSALKFTNAGGASGLDQPQVLVHQEGTAELPGLVGSYFARAA